MEVLDVEQLDWVLLLSAAVLLVAIAAVRLSSRIGLPSLLVYLGLGILLGEDVAGIEFDDAQLTRALGYAALVVILAEGGLTTNWSTIRPTVPAATVLATLGLGVSMAITAVAAYALLDVGWQLAFLVGAIVSSTDAAAVFSVLRRLPLPPRLVGLLEAESGFNDAPAVILVVALSAVGRPVEPLHLVGLLLFELALGALVGYAVGRLGATVLSRVALPASGLYPIAVLALAGGAYAIAGLMHASGFIAVYLAAVVLGNSGLPHRVATRGFAEGLAWVAQMGLFIMLGLLVTPSELGPVMLPALGVGLALLLVARPLSVLASTAPFRLPFREQLFLSWAGLRGAVPIVLATVPQLTGADPDRRMFGLVFVLVLVFTLVQGPTLPYVARRLAVAAPAEAHDLDVDAAPLEDLGAHLLQITIPDDSLLHGVEVSELRLPDGAAVTLVVREGRSFTPAPTTVLRHGDGVLIVTTAQARETTERRLRAVSRGGKLGWWLGERGT
ncbi:MAG: potassium/proton antiporter [Streptomycetales bacterium]